MDWHILPLLHQLKLKRSHFVFCILAKKTQILEIISVRYYIAYIRLQHIKFNKQQFKQFLYQFQKQTVDMSDQYEQIVPCVMCGQHHEQMLMLVCMDDPCINCAAIHYCSTQASNSNVYQCAKCKQLTDLDSTSIVELQRVYSQLKGKKKYDYRRGQGTLPEADKYGQRPTSGTQRLRQQLKTRPEQITQNKDPKNVDYQLHQFNYQTSSQSCQSYTPVSQPSFYPANTYTNIISRKAQQPFYMCQTHPEEELSYFCFSCSIPICPQCVIHGSHREHEVQTTRKAIKIIKINLQKCQDGVNQEIGSIVSIVDKYKNRMKEMASEIKKEKDLVKDNFSMLRKILNEKEKQFQRTIDSYYQSNNSIIKNQASSVDHVIKQHSNAKELIQNLLKKDDLTILQEYSRREKQANAAIESSKNKRYNPDLEGLKEIDYNMFKDEMNQFQGIMKDFKLTVEAKKKME